MLPQNSRKPASPPSTYADAALPAEQNTAEDTDLRVSMTMFPDQAKTIESLKLENAQLKQQLVEQGNAIDSLKRNDEEKSAIIDELRSHVKKQSTRELARLLSIPREPDKEDELVLSIREGADLQHYDSSRMARPVLHTLAARGLVEPLRVALEERKDPLDLRQVDAAGCTLLHTILISSPDGCVDAMLKVVRDRLGDCRIRTVVDWEQKNAAGDDVVNAAARHGRLNLFWKHMENLSYWDDKMDGEIELRVIPQDDDWVTLVQQNKERYFVPQKPATDELIRLHLESGGNPDVVSLKRCVLFGANVMAHCDDKYRKPLLFHYIGNDMSTHVKLCLESPCGIDFTVSDNRGMFPLYAIVCFKERVEEYLPWILDRLQGTLHGPNSGHPDTIDWGQTYREGEECISTAARNGCLGAFWRVVSERKVAYYMDRTEPIRITCLAHKSSFEALSDEVKRHFVLEKGMQEFLMMTPTKNRKKMLFPVAQGQ